MPTKLLQAIVMLLWAALFLWLFFVDQTHLARLLHPKLWWLALIGAVILIMFSLVTLSRLQAPHQVAPLRWTWPSIAIMLVPLCYFWPVQSAQLDSRAFLKRTPLERFPPAPEAGGISKKQGVAAADAPATVTSLSQLVLTPEQFSGQKAEILCQVMHSDKLPQNQFICYRFRITCCAADAMPVFTFVQLNYADSPPEQDTWVRVQGSLSVHTIDNLSFPCIQDATLTPETAPSFPYIF
nr:TIGR03943 family protein [uncultured Desulfobulbus sp.]